jgi:hypothetical protein
MAGISLGPHQATLGDEVGHLGEILDLLPAHVFRMADGKHHGEKISRPMRVVGRFVV